MNFEELPILNSLTRLWLLIWHFNRQQSARGNSLDIPQWNETLTDGHLPISSTLALQNQSRHLRLPPAGVWNMKIEERQNSTELKVLFQRTSFTMCVWLNHSTTSLVLTYSHQSTSYFRAGLECRKAVWEFEKKAKTRVKLQVVDQAPDAEDLVWWMQWTTLFESK